MLLLKPNDKCFDKSQTVEDDLAILFRAQLLKEFILSLR
jgi:hypothetical protein